MRALQWALDRAEDFCTRRHWVRATFLVMVLKQRLGLSIER